MPCLFSSASLAECVSASLPRLAWVSGRPPASVSPLNYADLASYDYMYPNPLITSCSIFTAIEKSLRECAHFVKLGEPDVQFRFVHPVLTRAEQRSISGPER
jgi:hypothetical protein